MQWPEEELYRDKQRFSRIYKDKYPPSPLKLVVTVLSSYGLQLPFEIFLLLHMYDLLYL
jgi:hypothetical protein